MGDLVDVQDLVALDAQEFRELLGAPTKHLRIFKISMIHSSLYNQIVSGSLDILTYSHAISR